MDDFEQQLKRAMGRTDPPAWFEAKVLAAATAGRRTAPRRWRLEWAVAGFMSVVVASGVFWHQERERRAGMEAKAKLELALKITSEKLQKIERQVESVRGN